ncbi:hypothetical protein SAMN05421841_0117 [Chryseobacterium wanjuense]|uniref:Uncharacterized protein n=1 Tax=Chryseobacterium wanjuense TaxID=356305 RepID=A0A1I0MQV3_9FLAO|nr:hypothetical protein SAMN05421841_0117 [Chryseobacterium wanjuense]
MSLADFVDYADVCVLLIKRKVFFKNKILLSKLRQINLLHEANGKASSNQLVDFSLPI